MLMKIGAFVISSTKQQDLYLQTASSQAKSTGRGRGPEGQAELDHPLTVTWPSLQIPKLH